MNVLSEMARLIERHTSGDGVFPTALERLVLIRSSRPTMPMPVLYEPSLCLVAQGRKQAVLGDRAFVYDPARYLIVSVELPVVGHVVEATPDEPYLCMALNFDSVALSDLVMRTPAPSTPAPVLGLNLCAASETLLDGAVRLLALLDDPAAAPILAPLVERELLYRLLTGPYGPTIRQMVAGHGRVAQVSRAIAWIKQHYTAPFRVEALAAAVGMSSSNLYEQFKAVTSMSPLQYQKQLRLQEARRLMLAGAMDAAGAAFEVGYESPSQFSREYRRLFGEPPARDINRLRAAPELMFAA